MQQEKIHVGARIPKDLYEQCVQRYDNMTNAINIGLDLLINQSVNVIENRSPQNENNIEGIELKIKVEERDLRIRDLQEQSKVKDQLQEARIADLKEQIQTLNEQIKKKGSGAKIIFPQF
jgi:hypothetical protein